MSRPKADPFVAKPAKRDANEWTLKDDVAEWLTKQKPAVWYLKVHGGGVFQRKAVLDYILCVNGHFMAIELKHPEDTSADLTPGQLKEYEWVLDAGGTAAVCRTLQQFTELVTSRLRR